MSSSVVALLGLFAAVISTGVGLLYGIAGTLLYMGFRGQFEADEPLWAIALIIVFLFGSAASGGFAGGAVAWAALRNDELARVARRGGLGVHWHHGHDVGVCTGFRGRRAGHSPVRRHSGRNSADPRCGPTALSLASR